MKKHLVIILAIILVTVSRAAAQNRRDELRVLYNEKDPVKKENLYRGWLQKYPSRNADSADKMLYDYARNAVAIAYAQQNRVKKALEYANKLESPVWKGDGWARVADALAKNGQLVAATGLYEKARANAYRYVTTNKDDAGAQVAAAGYPMYSLALSKLYIKQQKFNEALPVLKQLFDSSESTEAEVYESYALVLMQQGRDRDAFQVLEKAAKLGVANDPMTVDLKKLFVKLKGSDAGYGDYMAGINKAMVEKIYSDLAKTMINNPAADFTLKDVDGNPVSLTGLKGKTIVLDFWATWCGPCKSSFPIMKAALERYKNDSTVKFLFVHTWERDANASAVAKKYMMDNHYPFEVLMDVKNAEGVNPVAESYKLGGIPTKIVIDRNGNIRFWVTGFSGGEKAAVEEVAAMIELSKG